VKKSSKYMKPLLSIVLLSYNKSEWLAEGIESAINQDYEPKEIIVVDNHSNEDNYKIVKKYTNVRFVDIGYNSGCVGLVNRAIEESKGDYIMYFSHEDPLEKGIISEQMSYFDKDKNLEVIGSWYNHITSSGEYIYTFKTLWDKQSIKEYCCMSGCFIAKKTIYDKVSWREVEVKGIKAYQDWDFWLQCVEKDIKITVVPKVGFSYRNHESYTNRAIEIHEKFKNKLKNMNINIYN